MGKIKGYFLEMPIRKFMRWIFGGTFLSVCILSGVTVFGMNRIQSDILNRKEFTINSAGEYEMEPFTGWEVIQYYSCETAIFGLPLVYLALGMAISSRFFYRLKLQVPINELGHAIAMTAENDLDFTIFYSSGDELGNLCQSMERMRKELCRSNEKEWELLQQRRMFNASVAHDLRTPLTVLKGYLDYLQKDAGEKAVSDAEIRIVLDGMGEAVGRLERYVGCLRDMDRLENLKAEKRAEPVSVILQEMERAICPLGKEKRVEISSRVVQKELDTDKQLLFRMTENLVQNGVRYARSKVTVELRREGEFLVLAVRDDGNGFPPECLNRAADLFYTTEKETHFGIGLNICKMICDKLEGTLTIENREAGGACVTARIKAG